MRDALVNGQINRPKSEKPRAVASWALDAGKSVAWVQIALGHAGAATKLHDSAHFIPEEKPDMGFLQLLFQTERRHLKRRSGLPRPPLRSSQGKPFG